MYLIVLSGVCPRHLLFGCNKVPLLYAHCSRAQEGGLQLGQRERSSPGQWVLVCLQLPPSLGFDTETAVPWFLVMHKPATCWALQLLTHTHNTMLCVHTCWNCYKETR